MIESISGTKSFAAMGVLIVVFLANPALGAGVKIGKVTAVYADPSDFVVELDVAGDCGSKFYHVQRSRLNFKEAVAVFLTAYSTGKTVTLFVESCSGDRNILSHGGSVN